MMNTILALPLLCFFSRLLLTNHLVPWIKKRALLATLRQRDNWPMLDHKHRQLKRLFARDCAKLSSTLYRRLRWMTSQEFVYGEVDYLSFYTILEETAPQTEDILYDLGSGAGKAVLTAALFFDLAKVCGIELLPPLVKKARTKLQQLAFANVQLIQANFLEYDFSEATIVYIAATCLKEPTWQALQEKLACLRPGSRVIVATRTIQHPQFEMIYHANQLMSWGLCPVTIYKVNEGRKSSFEVVATGTI